jgi:CRISPR/Cas system-associated exonuclease Cas4 (RecB family)
MRKARTRRLAERISPRDGAAQAPGGGELRLEESQVALAGRLRGRPDAVRRGRETTVEDYKTGALLDDTGALRPAYRTQLLLYAVLEHETTGRWPAYARLVPLEGNAVEFAVDEAEAREAADAAVTALAAYNRAIEDGASIAIADASPAHCRCCPFAVACPAFWQAVSQEWEEPLAVAGRLAGTEASALETIDLVIAATAGTTGESPVRLHGLPADRFGHLLDGVPWSAVAAVGLRPGRVESELQATERTRVLLRDV